MNDFHTGRSGDEPLHARSPLGLRLGLAGFGLACAIAGIVVFTLADVPALVGVFAALAVVAVVDSAVIVRHLHSGAAFQPVPGTPPYRPPDEDAAPPPPPSVPPARRRHALFIWAAVAALVLVVNAWTWVQALSTGWATILSIVAGLLLLFGVVSSNTGSTALRGNSVPGTDEIGER